eukprot:7381011-Prymnesium_polylepis.2
MTPSATTSAWELDEASYLLRVRELLSMPLRSQRDTPGHWAADERADAGDADPVQIATWACSLVNASGLAAGTIPLPTEHAFSRFSVGVSSADLRCCVSRCALHGCSALDRTSGPGAHVIECGACPTMSTIPASSCAPGTPDFWSADRIGFRDALLGSIAPWDMSVCRSMVLANSTNSVHIRYFLAQQEAERRLLDDAEHTLCDGVEPSDGDAAEATYQRRLHSLLEGYRMATRLHINFDFLANTKCVPATRADRVRAQLGVPARAQAKYMEGFSALARGSVVPVQRMRLARCPVRVSPGPTSSSRGSACRPPRAAPGRRLVLAAHPAPRAVQRERVLARVELLERSAAWWRALLRPPARRARHTLFRTWRAQQDAIQAAHRANKAFSAYVTTYEEACHREASALPGGTLAARTLLDWEIAHAKLSDTDYIEAIRSHGPCDVANVTAADLIEAFGGDVELLIVSARRLAPDAADSGMETLGCGVFSDCALCEWTSQQVEELNKALGPLPASAVERVNQGLWSRVHFSPHPRPHWLLWAFTLAFAYHKLVPMCSRADPVVAGGLLSKPHW